MSDQLQPPIVPTSAVIEVKKKSHTGGLIPGESCHGPRLSNMPAAEPKEEETHRSVLKEVGKLSAEDYKKYRRENPEKLQAALAWKRNQC